jgi:hypothetical protein
MAASKLTVDQADERVRGLGRQAPAILRRHRRRRGIRRRARHPGARDLARRRTARLTAGQEVRQPYRCRDPQIHLRYTWPGSQRRRLAPQR